MGCTSKTASENKEYPGSNTVAFDLRVPETKEMKILLNMSREQILPSFATQFRNILETKGACEIHLVQLENHITHSYDPRAIFHRWCRCKQAANMSHKLSSDKAPRCFKFSVQLQSLSEKLWIVHYAAYTALRWYDKWWTHFVLSWGPSRKF